MLTLMLVTANEREKKILNMAFEQHQIKVIEAQPDHASYIKALQYSPDIVLLEFPSYYTEQLHFSNNINNSVSKKKKILIIGYGAKMVSAEERALQANGVKHYLIRPLKFSLVMKHIEEHLGVFAPEKIVWKSKNSSDIEENYIETMFNIDVLPTKKLEILSERIDSLLAFPFTVLRVLQLADDESSGASDLAQVINADPVISANIIKLANTVFFASRNRRIATIKDAIIRIGFKETKHLTMAMSVMNLLGEETDNIGFDRMEFWYHSLAVAVISERLSKGVNKVNSAEMFLNGLLHAFGIILLDEFFADLFERLLTKTTDKGGSFLETEKELMIVTHNDLTQRLFEKWKIPPQISDGIKNADNINSIIEKSPDNITEEEYRGIILYFADILAKSLGIGSECDFYIPKVESEIFDLLKLSTGINANFIESVSQDVDLFRRFLKLEEPDSDNLIGRDRKILLLAPPPPYFSPAEWYFQSLGFEIVRFKETEDHSTYNEQFTFVLFCFAGNVDMNKVNKIMDLRNAERMPLQSIIISEDETPEEKQNCYHFESSMDLRLLLITAQEIITPTEG